jgi:hypothetical protein
MYNSGFRLFLNCKVISTFWILMFGLFFASGCKKKTSDLANTQAPKQVDYRNKFIGEYEGEAYYFYEYPIINENENLNVIVRDTFVMKFEVVPAELDSTVNLYLQYPNAQTVTIVNLTVSGDGIIEKYTGGGSSAYNLNVSFVQDTLNFDLYQKHGMPVTETLKSRALKKNN